jgi:branched-chain amino acid transport system permease protein
MSRLRDWAPVFLLLIAGLVLPFLPFSEQVHKRLLSVSGIVFIYAILALGLNVVPGWTGLLDLGFVAFVAIGAYTVAILYRQPWMQWEGAWILCLLAAGLHCALWGLLRGAPTLRLVGDYYAIVTFAFAQIVLIFIQNCTPVTNAARGYTDFPAIRVGGHAAGVGTLPPGTVVRLPEGKGEISASKGGRLVFPRGGDAWAPKVGAPVEVPADVKVWVPPGLDWTNLPSGATVTVSQEGYAYTPPGRALFPDSKAFYFLLLGVVVLVFTACALLENSRLGRAWLAMKADEISAKSNGISIPTHRLVAFAVSGFIGGLGGGLQAFKVEIVTPGNYDFWVSVLVLACIVLGGMGSLRGVLVGTVVLISLGEVLREGVDLSPGLSTFMMTKLKFLENVAWQATGDHAMLKVPDQARYLVFGAILVATMIFRPQGLLPPRGSRERLDDGVLATRLKGGDALFRLDGRS